MSSKGGLLDAFFGPDTVEAWHLKHLGKVASAHSTDLPEALIKSSGAGASATTEAAGEVVKAALEFNANVPPEGISPATDKKAVINTLSPVVSLLRKLTKIKSNNKSGSYSPADQRAAERVSSILLQSVYRICKCVFGFQLFLETEGVLQAMAGLLRSREQFTVYWTVKVLGVMIACPFTPRNKEQEFVNKQVRQR